MIRYRALLIAAGYPDGNDCDALRADPAFKMAVGRLPESGADLCSQPTISRLENLPGPIALKRMMAAMVEVFCDSFEQVPRRILLDIDDTEDRVHGGQQLALFNAYYDSRCFQPIHIYEATTGKPVAIILRPGKTPDGAEVTLVLRHVIGHPRPLAGGRHRGARRQPLRAARGHGVVRTQAHRLHLRPRRQCGAAAPGRRSRRGCRARPDRWRGRQSPPLRRLPLRRHKLERRAPRHRPRRGRTPGRRQPLHRHQSGGLPHSLYEKVYCARGQAENLIKAHKLHLASDRTSCTKATANQFRLLIHTAAYWLLLTAARSGAPDLVLARCPVRYDPSLPDQGGRPRHRDGHPDQDRPADRLSLPAELGLARRSGRQAAALSPGLRAPLNVPSPTPNPTDPRPWRHHVRVRHRLRRALPRPSRMIRASGQTMASSQAAPNAPKNGT